MKNFTLRNAVLVAALAAVGATAWAANEYVVQKTDVTVSQTEPIAPDTAPIATPAAPVEDRSVAQPPVTVEHRRLTVDERIQADVMDKLANAQNISGKIGVESRDAVVTLTGYTVTAAQGQRAGRYAGSVEGVKSVNNELRARIGGSV